MIITEWVFMMFMNGWIVEVDTFSTHHSCLDKVQIYNKATKQADSPLMVWCESRPIKKLPVILKTEIKEFK
jgi:hypothetical protein